MTSDVADDVFNAVHSRPKRRQGITGQTVDSMMRGTMCQITEYELDVLWQVIVELKDALINCEAEIDAYIRDEYPLDHPVQERYRQRDFAANPARVALASLSGLS